MATLSSPPSPLFDQQRDMYAPAYAPGHFYLSAAAPPEYHAHAADARAPPPGGAYYFADGTSANSLHAFPAHDAGSARLAGGHQYTDAPGAALVQYAPAPAAEYITHPPVEWLPPQKHLHADGGAPAYAPPAPLPPYYDGELSPLSDSSGGTLHDSPPPSDAALLDERAWDEREHQHQQQQHLAPYAYYDQYVGVITAEHYSRLAGTDEPAPHTPPYYDAAPGLFHPAPQHAAYFAHHDDAPPQRTAYAPPRAPSPMAHLPYPEADGGFYGGYAQAGAYHGAIAIPAPRSPPLVEDMPKKPLTLACFFCRKRKIACGSPPPGRKDRTCNQCARRNLCCEYPVNSRRGTRQREAEAALYPSYTRAAS